MKKLYKNSIYNVIYRITNLLFPLITAGYVARILLPEGVGHFSYINTNVSYFVILATLGLPVYGIREIAKVKNEKEKINQTYSELFLLNLFFTFISCIIYLFFILKILSNKDLLLYAICGSQIIFNIINIDWLYQGYEEYSYIAKRNIVVKIVFFIAIILFVKEQKDLPIYALISCCATFGQYFYSIIRSRKFVSFNFKNISFKKHLKPIFVLGVTVIFGTIYNKIDITMLGFLTNDTEVGLYTNAHRCIEIITTLCASVTSVYLPALSSLYESDYDEFKKVLKNGFKIVCFISIPASFGLYMVAPELMKVFFGSDFYLGYTTIRIFIPIIIIRSIGDLFCYQTLIAVGKENKRVFASIVTTFINIVLNFILIPRIGRNGAAIASVISELLINGYLYMCIKDVIDNKLEIKFLLMIIISSLIMSLICYFLIDLMIINPFVNLFICIIISILVYFACTYLFNKMIGSKEK